MQQRLLQTQQSLERDYIRLRQAETRYRLLFDMAAEPVLIVDAGDAPHPRGQPCRAPPARGVRDGALVGTPVHTRSSQPTSATT